ncbi:hypothetical protein BD324DRAFT_426863 [Kockovaella imperatae]|uniref:Uncharacterized protein n=1 Tax=Kockovaella imperatae TaxID=4999 RepID=A0A1Y1UGL9_9TREE|nr:hypothetical protein BD324DRAFT_426863 [Kockovaella imperatae]ORX37119.1 hypothetical protein BD324DRAFT_426863 [Kockovaella imperatae]
MRASRLLIRANDEMCKWGSKRFDERGAEEVGSSIDDHTSNTNKRNTAFQFLCVACVHRLLPSSLTGYSCCCCCCLLDAPCVCLPGLFLVSTVFRSCGVRPFFFFFGLHATGTRPLEGWGEATAAAAAAAAAEGLYRPTSFGGGYPLREWAGLKNPSRLTCEMQLYPRV